MNSRSSLFLTRQSPNESVQESINFINAMLHTLLQAKEALSAYRPPQVQQGIDFYDEVIKFEISLIEQALKHSEGSQYKAASLLRLKPSTLNSKIKNLKINWKASK